jgi:hypothetical protein
MDSATYIASIVSYACKMFMKLNTGVVFRKSNVVQQLDSLQS